ncbi:MAG: MBL fold metallo-hydrolase, partial [Pyrinomonadaceae bacterium]|nr:MBL fold metallo-hydrolase [Pyrinomonadaceae bacterium]
SYKVGELDFKVLHCPGHTPGHVVLFAPKERKVFVGDVLFAGSIGRTDLPGGSTEQLMDAIMHKLLPLGDDVEVYSGHGPVTTIGQERLTNPFLTGTYKLGGGRF